MKTSSAKAKGRRLQQFVRDYFRSMGKPFGLVDGDIESRGMGQNGEDIVFSPAALKLFPWAVECKNREQLNVQTEFWKHWDKYKCSVKTPHSVLIHSKNRAVVPLVTMTFYDFIFLLEKGLSVNQGAPKTEITPGQPA